MFGYIKPLEDELKVRHYKLYRAVYCGLCKTAGARISVFSRFFLSYDYTFFAAVRMILEESGYTSVKKRCGFHLFAKKEVIAENNALMLSAAIFSLLTYYKLKDTIHDEGFFKSLGARILLPIGSRMRKKALKQGYTDADMIIGDCMERMSLLEKKEGVLACELAEAFGDMMGYLLKWGLPEDKKDEAYAIGFEVGRFIYTADAIDDLEEDEKKNRFNPYFSEYNSSADALAGLRKMRNSILRGTDSAADILSGKKSTLAPKDRQLCELSLNILYLGCPAVIDGIFRKKECKKK